MWGCYGIIKDSGIAIYLPRHNVIDAEDKVFKIMDAIDVIDDKILSESNNVLDRKIFDLNVNDIGVIKNILENTAIVMDTLYMFKFWALISLAEIFESEIEYIAEDKLINDNYKIIV